MMQESNCGWGWCWMMRDREGENVKRDPIIFCQGHNSVTQNKCALLTLVRLFESSEIKDVMSKMFVKATKMSCGVAVSGSGMHAAAFELIPSRVDQTTGNCITN
jgi:hypothetical protein